MFELDVSNHEEECMHIPSSTGEGCIHIFFIFFLVKVTDLKKEEMHGQKKRSEAGTGKSAQVLIWKSYKQKSITLLHPGSKPMHAV